MNTESKTDTEIEAKADAGAKTEMPLVSVLLPVYNRGTTVARCIDSLLEQTYRNMEFVIVNDGSTDDTLSVLLEYAKRDRRITVINKPNSGVSDSRNFALESAHGDYIQFVDSDDWIPENAAEEYVQAALSDESDFVVADYYRVRGRQIRQCGAIRRGGLYTRTEFAEEMMDNAGDFYYGVVWNKLFRRDIIAEHRLSFSDKLDWCEDFLFNLSYLSYVQKITVLKKPLYFYVKTKGSLVSTKTTPSNVIRTKLLLFEYYKALYQSLDLYEENKRKIQRFLVQGATDKKKRIDRETYESLAEKYQVGQIWDVAPDFEAMRGKMQERVRELLRETETRAQAEALQMQAASRLKMQADNEETGEAVVDYT